MLTLGNGTRTHELTEHEVHLLRTALAYASQQMRKDMHVARELNASTSARQWSRTSLKFAALYGVIESLEDDDDDEPSTLGAGAFKPAAAAPDAAPDAAAS